MKNRVKRYERFGEVIRYLTMEELKLFFDSIDNYKHKLMFEVMYELGCRVGEFVRIQIKHINFGRSAIFFPAQNTKTKYARLSYLPPGLTNEIKSLLKQQKLMTKREETIRNPDAYLFHPGRRWNTPYTENRIRQLFQQYVNRAGLQQTYGTDSLGRNLRMFTVHSLRHSHVMHYAVDRGVALPIVQKQVGHRSLKTTSVYLSPSTEKIGMAYRMAQQLSESHAGPGQSLKYHVNQ
jgi:integrase